MRSGAEQKRLRKLMTQAKAVAAVTSLPYQETLNTLLTAHRVKTGKKRSDWITEVTMYRRRSTFQTLSRSNNTVLRIACEKLGHEISPSESHKFRDAIRARAKTQSFGDPEESWNRILNGKVTIVPDMTLVLAVIYAIYQSDIDWAQSQGDEAHLIAMKTERTSIAEHLMKYGLMLDAKELLGAFEGIYKRAMTSVGIQKQIIKAINDLKDRRQEVPEPYYVAGACRGFQTIKGCMNDKGRSECNLRHQCFQCGSAAHGWADCDRLKSMFRGGNGSGITHDNVTRLAERKRREQRRNRSRAYYDRNNDRYRGRSDRYDKNERSSDKHK